MAAAHAADIPVLVTHSAYFGHATIEGAVAIGPGLHDRHGWRPATAPDGAGATTRWRVGLDDIEAWCATMDRVSQNA